MGYRRVNVETLHEILQRLRAGDSNRRIAVCLGLDRKTVNQYVAGISKVVVRQDWATTTPSPCLRGCSARTESPSRRTPPWSRGRPRFARSSVATRRSTETR